MSGQRRAPPPRAARAEHQDPAGDARCRDRGTTRVLRGSARHDKDRWNVDRTVGDRHCTLTLAPRRGREEFLRSGCSIVGAIAFWAICAMLLALPYALLWRVPVALLIGVISPLGLIGSRRATR